MDGAKRVRRSFIDAGAKVAARSKPLPTNVEIEYGVPLLLGATGRRVAPRTGVKSRD
jgi:hypothetical protein